MSSFFLFTPFQNGTQALSWQPLTSFVSTIPTYNVTVISVFHSYFRGIAFSKLRTCSYAGSLRFPSAFVSCKWAGKAVIETTGWRESLETMAPLRGPYRSCGRLGLRFWFRCASRSRLSSPRSMVQSPEAFELASSDALKSASIPRSLDPTTPQVRQRPQGCRTSRPN